MGSGRIVAYCVCAAMCAAAFGRAMAADMPVKIPLKAPIYAPWAGFYAGVHGGYGWDPAEGNFDPQAYGATVVPGLFLVSGTGPLHLKVNPAGWYGGAQAGYNWQTGPWVIGVEADVSYGRIKDENVQSFAVVAFSPTEADASYSGNVRLRQELDYFGTLRARFGWAFNSLLLYGTGGFAWGHVTTTFDVFNVSASADAGPAVQAALQAGARATSSQIQYGYAVGGGLEWIVNRPWRLKAEYLYMDLGNNDATLVIPGGTASSSFFMHTLRIGLNRAF